MEPLYAYLVPLFTTRVAPPVLAVPAKKELLSSVNFVSGYSAHVPLRHVSVVDLLDLHRAVPFSG